MGHFLDSEGGSLKNATKIVKCGTGDSSKNANTVKSSANSKCPQPPLQIRRPFCFSRSGALQDGGNGNGGDAHEQEHRLQHTGEPQVLRTEVDSDVVLGPCPLQELRCFHGVLFGQPVEPDSSCPRSMA